MGLIERERPPEDRRTVRVRATAAGERIVSTITDSRQQDLVAVLGRMEPARVDQFIEIFSEFVEGISELVESKGETGEPAGADDSASHSEMPDARK